MKTLVVIFVLEGLIAGCASHESHMTSYPGDRRISECKNEGRSWNWISGVCK